MEDFFFSPFIKIFFWSLAVLFIGFILHKLFFTQGIFQRSTTSSNVTVIEEKPEDGFATADYASLINKAAAAGNYRLAIRYHYLQTLQKLSTKSAIQFAAAKTK